MVLFPPGKMGGTRVARGYKGKGTAYYLILDGNGWPLGITVTAANEDERKQVPQLLNQIPFKEFCIMESDKGKMIKKFV